MTKTAHELAVQYCSKLSDETATKAIGEAFIAGYLAAQPEWIPVTERLPERMQPVLFEVSARSASENGAVLGGRYTGNPNDKDFENEFSIPGTGYRASKWCPIPESLLNFKP